MADQVLERLQLSARADTLAGELSHGQQRVLEVGMSICSKPKLLMLDEPSAGLDPITSAGLDALIRRLAGSLHITFVIVTHELASIYAIADLVIMLDKRAKGIIAEGDPRVLRDTSTQPTVRAFFRREALPAAAA